MADSFLREFHRCLLCHDPPCRAGCPAGVNPREFIRKVRFDNIAGAARSLRRANVLAGSCAWICPCGATCAARCTAEGLDRPIDIGALQRFVTDWERSAVGSRQSAIGSRQSAIGNPVAAIGAGPAGLAAAADLALRGRRVVVFDGAAAPGGMLRIAIPRFRLPAEVLDHDVSIVEALGVEFRCGRQVADLDDLFAEGFAAVFVATGVQTPRRMGVPGEALEGVVPALDLLVRANAGRAMDLGRRVVVIGGGDVALDAARTLRRAGARVTLAYRRARADMPAYAPEVAAALDEGVEFLFDVVPVEVRGERRVGTVVLQRVRWEAGGRDARHREAEGSPLVLEADSVVVAVGQENRAAFGLDAGPGGLIRVDPETGMTSRDGVFAAGDVVT
ncbi:MAG: FAD-dependent oxidoreductase, partial [Myxococcota bacterium]|nr:FAD-dependent oxidoreductase [Myxococcota bacterium]